MAAKKQAAKPAKAAWPEVALQKLALSKLDQAMAEQLGIRFLADATELSPAYPKMPCLVFHYWDYAAKQFVKTADFHRIRLLGEHPDPWVRQQKDQPRYLQPAKTLNRVYLPIQGISGPVDWQGAMKDTSQALLITEGELKAACACLNLASLLTVGLGGVTMWSARGKGLEELPFFADCEWAGRPVYVCFDTDEQGGLKEPVAKAAKALMEHLVDKGARPHLVTLPWAGKKVGLDDYLLANHAGDFLELVEQAMVYDAATELLKFNQRFYWVEDLAVVADAATGTLHRKEHFVSTHSNRTVYRMVKKAVGQPRRPGLVLEALTAGQAFMQWEARPTVQRLCYKPGGEQVVEGQLNRWQGWAAEPTEGDISPFMWVLDNVFGDDPVARQFIEHWFFYPLKYPGTKLYTICLVMSPLEGIGKTFPAEMLARYVYGLLRPNNAVVLQEGDLAGDFNSFLEAKQLVVGDDIAGHDAYQHLAKLKGLVTNEFINCKRKYVPDYTIENRSNLYLTSNQLVPFKLNDDDRRFFTHEPKKAVKDLERYERVKQWFEEGGGGHLLWHAQHRYEEGSFHPRDRAPQTTSRLQLIERGKSVLEAWVDDLKELVPELPDVMTPSQIFAMMQHDLGAEVSGVTKVTLGRAMAKAGFKQWRNGLKIRVSERQIERAYVFKNHEAWERCEGKAVAAEVNRVLEIGAGSDGKVVPLEAGKKTKKY